MTSAATRAVLLAVVLMQCCKVFVAARPLLEAPAVAGGDGTSWQGLIMQVLQGTGGNNHNCQAPNGSCP
jgi:hypothetical protein